MADVDTTNWIPGTRYFTQITAENHSGWLYIITLLSLCYISIVFGIRFAVKFGMYGKDDWALLVSTFLAVCQHVSVLLGLGHGMGKSSKILSHGSIAEIEKYTTAHIFLYIAAHGASKLSSGLLMQRLFQNGRKRNIILCWVMIGASVFYTLFAIMAFAINCPSPAFPLRFSTDKCSNRSLRSELSTAIDVLTELMLVVTPCLLLLDVQIKRDAKALIMAVFAVRLPDIIFSIFFVASLQKALRQPDSGLAFVYPIVWTQTELLWSIIAASVPCLKTFMRPFDKIDEDTWRSNNDLYASQRSGRSWRDPKDKDVPLDDLRRRSPKLGVFNAGSANRSVSDRGGVMVGNNVTISHPSNDAASDDARRQSWGSQERIIKAQVQWEVRHETPTQDFA